MKMQSLNSDAPREQLKGNINAMNRLTEQNDKIIDILADRGLKPIEFKHTEPTPGALTTEELRAGGWYCLDTSADCGDAFAAMGLNVYALYDWGCLPSPTLGSWKSAVWREQENQVTRSLLSKHQDRQQIYRVGNNFYWGEPGQGGDK